MDEMLKFLAAQQDEDEFEDIDDLEDDELDELDLEEEEEEEEPDEFESDVPDNSPYFTPSEGNEE